MSKIYKVSPTQAFIIFLFGSFSFFWALAVSMSYESKPIYSFLAIFFLFATIFYIIGYRENNKSR